MLRKFEHLLSIYYQSWETMFLAERNIKFDIRLDIKFDIKLDIKFVLDRGVSGGLERVLHSASAAYILSWWFTWNTDLREEGTWVFLATQCNCREPREEKKKQHQLEWFPGGRFLLGDLLFQRGEQLALDWQANQIDFLSVSWMLEISLAWWVLEH